MKAKKITLLLSILTLFAGTIEAQIFQYFLKPQPLNTTSISSDEKKSKALVKPVVTIPALKLIESTREEAEIDVVLLASAGGGVAVQWFAKKAEGDKKNYVNFSVSPLTILISGDTSQGDSLLDLAWVTTFGFFNNSLQLAIGRDFGQVSEGRNRLIGGLTLGINLTNNEKTAAQN